MYLTIATYSDEYDPTYGFGETPEAAIADGEARLISLYGEDTDIEDWVFTDPVLMVPAFDYRVTPREVAENEDRLFRNDPDDERLQREARGKK